MIEVFDINDRCDEEKLLTFCEDSTSDTKMPGSANLDVDEWFDKPNTLLHTIFTQKRFTKENRAGYIIVEKNNSYVAGSGFFALDEDPNVCICASRTYTLVDERLNMYHGNYILPMQYKYARLYNYKTLIMTFNEYNLWLKKSVERLSSGGGLLGKKVPEAFYGWNSLEYPILLKGTKQWCLYKHIDPQYDESFKNTMLGIKHE